MMTPSEENLQKYLVRFFRRHPKLSKYRGLGFILTNNIPGEARQDGDRILVSPKFFRAPASSWDIVLAHEIGHWALDAFGLSSAIAAAQDLGVDMWDSSNLPFGQMNMHEAFADSFGSYFTDRDVIHQYPQWAKLVEIIYGRTEKLANNTLSGMYELGEIRKQIRGILK